MNKFDLPAFFDREYYESRYLAHKAKGNDGMAEIWEEFYFDNALSFAWNVVFNSEVKNNPKKAMEIADNHKKSLSKSFK